MEKETDKRDVTQATKFFEQGVKEGSIKIIGYYWTLGRHDVVCITEAKDEKTIMKWGIQWGDLMSTETLVAVPREEAIKLVE